MPKKLFFFDEDGNLIDRRHGRIKNNLEFSTIADPELREEVRKVFAAEQARRDELWMAKQAERN